MANAPTKNAQSSIGMALAGQSHRVDIPKPNDANSLAAGTASRSAPASKGVDLPTPPASISPSLPPQAYQQHRQALLGVISPPSPPSNQGFESDIDLQDAVEHARAQDALSRPKRREPAAGPVDAANLKSLDARALAAFDSSNAITASMLARDFLPAILLEHGPLAIRYIMGFLTQNVPGFSGIPAAKARRLVVSALEGGFNQEVEFEKVGWGRWDAHKAGEQSRARQTSPGRELSGLPRYDTSRERSQASRERSVDHVYPSYPSQPTSSLRIPRTRRPTAKRRPSAQLATSASPDLAGVQFEETDVDRMSLDGDEGRSRRGSSTTNPDDLPANDEDMDDVTDDEDWASIGAAALRQASYSHSHGSNRMLSAYGHSHGARHPTALSHRPRENITHAGVHKRSSGGARNNSLAKSAPSPQVGPVRGGLRVLNEDALNGCTDDDERAAIAVLMRMGAM